ncbi:MAG: biotin carboxylase [Bacteroidetes bacterium GWF2_33_38]|nr:MAG: biotin carboxylase [Bacteroidetes bacterium GWF2_33_38]OFY91648.1 MAG: biotin carboxylase [Bacteroidetes bacterium RIFOXYA2_FULL_33_7]HBX50620.1 biotin carboxylase [Bacteroidales bacterium]
MEKKIIKKLLIANRGEIAIRIIETAKKLGIETYVIKTAKEPSALYLKHADVICDFTQNTNELPEFLDVELIIKTAKEHKVDAIHPGYGFLAENPYFAQCCDDEGIIFIGPSADAIYKMGNKTIAKQLAIKHKVPLLEGSSGNVPSPKEALKIAEKIGYPVIIKAASGGGGRGMRIVEDASQVEKMFHLASNEAAKAFDDSSVFIEKYVRNPRHIEFQILGDKHGNIIHLGERECSIQRKHQKLIEESPSVALSEELRKIMGEQAINIAKSVKYCSVGTVEFLLDDDMNFYFMEMNTRIQVEHPVTETITGIDLIEQQIKMAQGDKLSIKQEDVQLNGWAIEYRINAEDVQANFSPFLGTIQHISFPKGKNVRVDTGVEDGSVITPYYDSMVAKLIVSGETREKAIANSLVAINKVKIKGVKTTIPFCKAVIENKDFQLGNLNTSFIDKKMDGIFNEDPDEKLMAAFFATMDYIKDEQMDEAAYVDFEKGRNITPWLIKRRIK